jgi:hypothetical protein
MAFVRKKHVAAVARNDCGTTAATAANTAQVPQSAAVTLLPPLGGRVCGADCGTPQFDCGARQVVVDLHRTEIAHLAAAGATRSAKALLAAIEAWEADWRDLGMDPG